MKQINVVFDDNEHKKLCKKKKELGLNWHDFLLRLLELNIETVKKK